MCAGTIYWANIGRVVYAASEKELRRLTGEANGENMGLDLPCRVVLTEVGQKKVGVFGPVEGWEKRVVESARRWWEEHR